MRIAKILPQVKSDSGEVYFETKIFKKILKKNEFRPIIYYKGIFKKENK